ncbi:hypothetical protein L6164_021378 [Bauhinia variegata]|uniref:Uncharacterized protein n=1 Tax=Bauhinia variegata TaxID=167791 RepID=A0ACB9MYK4_BAUVA|nr:hypothetical protein L6164_021378 [Bauhinia variegata]
MNLFTAKSMELYEYIRQEERDAMLEQLFNSANTPITLRDYISTLNVNVISRMVLGKKYVENDENAVVTHREFNELIQEYFVLNGFVNVGDLIPWVGFLDLQGLVKRMKAWPKKFDRFLEHVLDEHVERRKGVKDCVANDMVDVLLEVAEDPSLEVKLERHNVKALTQDLIIGGTETSQVSIEWTMSELLKNPETINKAREELDTVIGRERWVEEKDVGNLPYIEAIVKESLRLHPVVPILAPKEAREDCNVAGYDISKGTQLLVNVWSLGRDPSVWEYPNEFRPERFLGKDIDVKGHDFGLLPFGAGRRMCPAYSLGLRVVQATVANLLHGFQWRLTGNMKAEDLKMEETYGLSTPIKEPLKVVVYPRLPLHLYSNLV